MTFLRACNPCNTPSVTDLDIGEHRGSQLRVHAREHPCVPRAQPPQAAGGEGAVGPHALPESGRQNKAVQGRVKWRRSCQAGCSEGPTSSSNKQPSPPSLATSPWTPSPHENFGWLCSCFHYAQRTTTGFYANSEAMPSVNTHLADFRSSEMSRDSPNMQKADRRCLAPCIHKGQYELHDIPGV